MEKTKEKVGAAIFGALVSCAALVLMFNLGEHCANKAVAVAMVSEGEAVWNGDASCVLLNGQSAASEYLQGYAPDLICYRDRRAGHDQ